MDRIVNRPDDLIRSVEALYELAMDQRSIQLIQRPYDSQLLTLRFSTTGQATYLIKEFDSHSVHHLQSLFSALEKIRNYKPQLSFPLCSKHGYYSFTVQDGRHFQILKFLDLSPFDTNEIPLERLFRQLARLHLNLSQCRLQPNRYADLRGYVVLGLRRIRQKYGANLPFLPRLEAFIERFPVTSIRQGERHGDIQETNVHLCDEELIFIDCDDAHLGYPLMDYIQGAVMYLDQNDLVCSENQVIVEKLWRQARIVAPDISQQDVRYFLARVILGPVQGGDVQPDKAALTKFLRELEDFCQ